MKRVNEFGYSADMLDEKAPGALTDAKDPAPAIESSDKKADKKKVKSSADKKDD